MGSQEPREIVVIGGSAGGVEALTKLVPLLLPDPGTAYLVVVHIGQGGRTALASVLSAKATMPVEYAADGQPLTGGSITVAPPGVHTALTRTTVRLLPGPRENGHRPAIDVLFRSAATAFGARVIGVILSGALDDGASGLAAIKAAGGRAYAQDPDEALYPSMPLSAIGRSAVDGVLPIEGIARVLAERRSGTGADGRIRGEGVATMEQHGQEAIDGGGADEANELDRIGTKSGLTCPGCGGALWEVRSDGVTVLRCHIGHAYGLDSFDFEQSLALESALWTAVRTLEEKQMLITRLSEHARSEGRDRSADAFSSRAEGLQRQADALRQLVEQVMSAEGAGEATGSVPA